MQVITSVSVHQNNADLFVVTHLICLERLNRCNTWLSKHSVLCKVRCVFHKHFHNYVCVKWCLVHSILFSCFHFQRGPHIGLIIDLLLRNVQRASFQLYSGREHIQNSLLITARFVMEKRNILHQRRYNFNGDIRWFQRIAATTYQVRLWYLRNRMKTTIPHRWTSSKIK